MSMLKINALILIAAWAGNTWAAGTNVYKCGATYSQMPCDGSQAISMDDGRSSDQKTQSEAVAKHQAQVANTLEKTRLKDEAQAQANKTQQASAKVMVQANKKKAAEARDAEKYAAETPVVLSAPKRKSRSHREPEYFTAQGGTAPSKTANTPIK